MNDRDLVFFDKGIFVANTNPLCLQRRKKSSSRVFFQLLSQWTTGNRYIGIVPTKNIASQIINRGNIFDFYSFAGCQLTMLYDIDSDYKQCKYYCFSPCIYFQYKDQVLHKENKFVIIILWHVISHSILKSDTILKNKSVPKEGKTFSRKNTNYFSFKND